jgi:uncharacterized protein with GYD domain
MLFCITANYTAKALNAMRENPGTNRQEAVEQLVKAAGGKLVAMYFTLSEGPGAMAIIDVDPIAGAAITGTIASSEAVQNVKMMRLWTQDEVTAVRQKRAQLHKSYKPPGQ